MQLWRMVLVGALISQTVACSSTAKEFSGSHPVAGEGLVVGRTTLKFNGKEKYWDPEAKTIAVNERYVGTIHLVGPKTYEFNLPEHGVFAFVVQAGEYKVKTEFLAAKAADGTIKTLHIDGDSVWIETYTHIAPNAKLNEPILDKQQPTVTVPSEGIGSLGDRVIEINATVGASGTFGLKAVQQGGQVGLWAALIKRYPNLKEHPQAGTLEKAGE